MLRLRGTFDGEYLSFDLVASLARLQELLADHLDRHYPGECVAVTVALRPEVRYRASRRHEEYICDPVWYGREWIVWEAPHGAADPPTVPPLAQPLDPPAEEARDARPALRLSPD